MKIRKPIPYQERTDHSPVRPKKHLGQHFLTNDAIAQDITDLLSGHGNYKTVLEIGPGTGMLTKFLAKRTEFETWLLDIDEESIAYLKKHFPAFAGRTLLADFLTADLDTLFPEPFAVIGNFPYNISSQIFFCILDHRRRVPEVVCMLQYEVAKRLASPPGGRDYGILSVLLQAFYNIEYGFTVDASNFLPPPNVQSGVIRLKSNGRTELPCDEKRWTLLVKTGFNMRRKTLRNALKSLNLPAELQADPVMDLRAEALSSDDFILMCVKWELYLKAEAAAAEAADSAGA
ncbi:MAG: 16S rRNA (adenine(1518)-N(6)/adenine(1519)-N(6))-dimethyltransferase RsmA [Bacteroidota bacterium]